MTSYRSTDDIVRANREAGNHFFDRDTMRFFESRVYGSVHHGRYFVSSERNDDRPRMYLVRVIQEDGTIDTLEGQPLDGSYNHGFPNYAAAVRWLEERIDAGLLPSYGETVIHGRRNP